MRMVLFMACTQLGLGSMEGMAKVTQLYVATEAEPTLFVAQTRRHIAVALAPRRSVSGLCKPVCRRAEAAGLHARIGLANVFLFEVGGDCIANT
jgi:hypothetical protein